MNNLSHPGNLVYAIIAGLAMCGSGAGAEKEPARPNAAPDSAPGDPRYPNCIKIFNGINFEGWSADPSTWSVVDGAMRGVGGTSRLAYTKADYASFRLIFTARMNPVNGDHLGVLFWGDRPTDAWKPKIDNAGWIQFMPPFAGMWDYHPPQHRNLPHEKIAQGSNDSTQWCTTEILCNLEKGTMRAAVGGIELARYTHPTPGERKDPEKRIVPGPIGLFRHGGGASEYKDVYVEANPQEDVLITVTPASTHKTFIDYFLPMPSSGSLSSSVWGAATVGPRDPLNGLEDVTMKQWCYWDGQILKSPDDVPKEQEKGNDNHGSKVIVLPFDGAALDRDLEPIARPKS